MKSTLKTHKAEEVIFVLYFYTKIPSHSEEEKRRQVSRGSSKFYAVTVTTIMLKYLMYSL